MYRSIVPFSAPKWASHLPGIPKSRAILARLPTPIHAWRDMPGVPKSFSLSIKRDDLTGSTFTGSKIRKLEFLFADAISKNYNAVITCGSIQSNLGRATVAAARELGLDPYLVLRAFPEDAASPDRLPVEGNQLVNRMVGTSTVLAPNAAYLTHLKPRVEKLAADILKRSGKKAYYIPMAAPDVCGLWGYMEAFREMIEQGVLEDFDDVVHTCGSGGLAYGLAIANHLCGSPVRVHSISVANPDTWYHGHLDTELRMLDFPKHVLAKDILNVSDGFRGAGYGKRTERELEFVLSVSRKTGIILDPVYAGKAALGMVTMMQEQPERFRGNRVLFIHTGGLLGMYGMNLGEEILQKSPRQVVEWMDGPSEPPFISGEEEYVNANT